MASWSPSEGSCAPGGPHLAAKAARKPNLGGSWGALGALLVSLGAVLEPLWPALGPPGPLLGLRGASFWRFAGHVLVDHEQKRRQARNLVKHAVFAIFCGVLRPPGALRTCSKTLPEGPQGGSWDPRPVWRAHVEVPGAQVGLHEAKLEYPGRFGTLCRGTQGCRNLTKPAHLKSPQVKIPSKCSNMD